MTPNIETEIGQVSTSEAEGYSGFVNRYSEYWKEYFDPIGIRFSMNGGITVDTCILPLINNSIYSSLAALTGREAGELHPDSSVRSDIMSLCLRINPDEFMSGEIVQRAAGKKTRLSAIFGNEIQVHMGDCMPLTDFDGSFIIGEYMQHGLDRSEAFNGLLVWSLFHPMRIALPVKKAEEALSILDGLNAEALTGSSYFRTERYSFDYKGTQVRALKLTLFYTMTFRIYYCVRDGTLHAATTEKYIKEVLDAPGAVLNKSANGNAVFVFRPGALDSGRDSYASAIIESALESSRRNTGTIRLLSLIYPSATDRELAGLAYRDFAFMPVCALGGTYTVDRRTGEVRNSMYGSRNNPVLKPGKEGVYSSLNDFFSTKEIRVELEFTAEGLRTRIRTQ